MVAEVDAGKRALRARRKGADEGRVLGARADARLPDALDVEAGHKAEQRVDLDQQVVEHLDDLREVAAMRRNVDLGVRLGAPRRVLLRPEPGESCIEKVGRTGELLLERRPQRLRAGCRAGSREQSSGQQQRRT